MQVLPPHRDGETTRWVRGANRGDPTPGKDYVFTAGFLRRASRAADIVLFPDIDGYEELARFRHTWYLQRRARPVVPCPENTPLPSRRNTKEHRSKLLSVYLRPWTLLRELETAEVPFLTDLRYTRDEWTSRSGPRNPEDRSAEAVPTTSMRRAWKDYLTRVPPTAVRSVKNFLMTTMAEGRNVDRDDTALDAAEKMPTITCTLTVAEVSALLEAKPPEEDIRGENAQCLSGASWGVRAEFLVRVGATSASCMPQLFIGGVPMGVRGVLEAVVVAVSRFLGSRRRGARSVGVGARAWESMWGVQCRLSRTRVCARALACARGGEVVRGCVGVCVCACMCVRVCVRGGFEWQYSWRRGRILPAGRRQQRCRGMSECSKR